MKEKDIVIKRYQDCKTTRQEYTSLWKDVQYYVAPSERIRDTFEDDTNRSDQKDIYINDPTAYIAATQAADYILGIIWGNGDDVFQFVPSRHVKDLLQDPAQLDDFFQWATGRALAEMNHSEGGLIPSLKSHTLDQSTFGTSGVGGYINTDYVENKADNALQFNRYGVYNSCIDEGANGKINVVYSVHNWRVSRIIDEFAVLNGKLNKKLLAKLPDAITKAYDAGNYNQRFKIVHGVLPHSDFSIGKAGKKGTKFKGFWFYEPENNVFSEEYYKEMPIAMCRSIKVTDQIYGTSAGILSLSSIKMLNYVTGNTIEAIEKLVEPARGMFNGALANGSVMDTSSGQVTVFNGKAAEGNPLFNISDVGDVTGNVQVLIPKAERDITTIFKIDQLLDFNSQTQMTATEAMQRFSIRAKSLSGLIQQQKNELLIPLIKRSVSLLSDLKLLGVKPDSAEAEEFARLGKDKQIIPPQVVEIMQKGLNWFEIKFNNELDQMSNAQRYEDYSKYLLLKQQLLGTDPSLALGMNQFNELQFAKTITNLDTSNFVKSETEYDQAKQQEEQLRREAMQLEAQKMQSETAKNVAGAEKDAREAEQI